MRRSRLAALLAIAVVVSVTATLASTAGGAQRKIRIAVFLASAANTYWTAELQGARDVAKKYGNVELTVFDGQFNTNKQVNQLRDALISKRFHAWFVGPNDGGPLTPTLRRAVAQGVKVGCALVPCGPNIRSTRIQIPGQTVFAGIGFYPNGQLLGQLVVQGCRGIDPCEVFWMPGLPELPLEKARTDGLYSIINKEKNIKVVSSTVGGGYLAAPALKATQNVLQANPGIDVIVSSGDQMIDGAYRAARLAGLDRKIKMYGNGCTFEAKRQILAGRGETGCSVYMPRTEARIVVDLLVRAVNGEQVAGRSIDPLTQSPIGPVGTRANIARFQPEFHS
jgi:ribose transport system substrate-binding protein